MYQTKLKLIVMYFLGAFILSIGAYAQDGRPIKSQDQEMDKVNVVPKNFTTEIIAIDDEGRKRAQDIIEIYKILSTEPTPDNLKKYLSDNYVQHSTMVPDGYNGLAMVFSSSVKQYPVEIDVHRIMVIGDWAMAHVNFRNLDTTDPDDLGTAAVDLYYYAPDGKVLEHWDVLQAVPTYSVNPNGMFLKITKD